MASAQNNHVKPGVINDFQNCLNSGSHIDALFLDFAKAFDKVSHIKL